MNILACACSFNPLNYQSHKRNLRCFYERWPLNFPLKIAEVSYNRSPYVLDDSLKLKTNSVLWQKEKVLNHLISQWVDIYDAIVWVDADILWRDPNTVLKKFERAFEKHDVVQGFRTSYRLSKEDTGRIQRDGVLDLSHLKGSDSLMSKGLGATNCDLGLCWGARSEWLKQVDGLYNHGILGGGDFYLIEALKGNVVHENRFMRKTHEDYIYKVRATSPSVGMVDCDIIHQFHGDFKNRKYGQRYDIARKHNFDPLTDLKSAAGTWEWNHRTPFDDEFHKDVYNYFMERREDE